MTKQRCAYCGGPMNLVRAGSKFCTSKCGTYYRRKRDKFPEEMKKHRRFVRFTSTKRPITLAGTSASSTNPETWTTFTEAMSSIVGEGVGFVLGDGFGCIDLDHCITDGVVAPWAQAVVDANPNTYIEVSRSGEGLHVFGKLVEGRGKKIRDGRNIEIYSTGRYIAMTGNRFGHAPASLAQLHLPSV